MSTASAQNASGRRDREVCVLRHCSKRCFSCNKSSGIAAFSRDMPHGTTHSRVESRTLAERTQCIGSWFGFGPNETPVALFPQGPADTAATIDPISEIEASSRPEQTSIPETATADTDAQAPQGPDLWLAFLRQGPDEFRDAVAFCSKTVLVEALRKLILCAKLRLTAKGGDPVVVLEMEPGFGKTHSMLAPYHIFSGIPLSRLPGMEGIVGGTGVPNPLKVRRAVLVGDRISP